jgi:tetratricopeptide (TPR) repeat protein
VRAFLRAHRAALTTIAAAGLAFLMLRFVVFPSAAYASRPVGAFWTQAATGVLAIGQYVRLLFVPAPLCADYRGVIAPVTSLADARFLLAAAAIVAIVAIAWFARRQAPLVTWGVATFLIGLLPVANIVPIPVPIAERFVYLPYIGGITAVVIGVEHVRRTLGRLEFARGWLSARAPLFAVLVMVACALAFLTWTRHGAWKDNESLWSKTLADHPGAYGAMHGLAVVRLDQDRFDEAEALLRRALESPDMEVTQRAGMLDELGTTYASAGKFEQAVPVFRESLKLGEGPKTHYNLGTALVLLGRSREGELHLRRAIELNPYYAKPYPLLIELARSRGDVAEAERLEKQQPASR